VHLHFKHDGQVRSHLTRLIVQQYAKVNGEFKRGFNEGVAASSWATPVSDLPSFDFGANWRGFFLQATPAPISVSFKAETMITCCLLANICS
jgi:hypothetical protein